MRPLLSVSAGFEPLERIRADVLVVGVGPLDRPLRGAAGYADWRMAGQLWKFVADGRIGGVRGEATLVIPGVGLGSPLLLVLGLGPRRSINRSVWQEFGRDAADRAIGLCCEKVAIALVPDATLGVPLADRARNDAVGGLISGAARAIADRGVNLSIVLLGVSEASLETGSVPAGVEVQLSRSHVSAGRRNTTERSAGWVSRGVQGNPPVRRFT